MLNADAWQRLSELFHRATQLPESERIGFIHSQTGDDPELQRLVMDLQREQMQVSAPMPARAIKEMHAQASYAMRGRDFEGKARKGQEPPQR